MRRFVSLGIAVCSILFLVLFFHKMESTKEAMAEAESEPGFFLTCGEEAVYPWSFGSETYFFLPSYFDWRQTELNVFGGELYVEEQKAESGVVAGRFEKEMAYSYRFVSGEEVSGTLLFLQSDKVGTVFIETESGSMAQVDADKEYRESGKILVKDEEGKVLYQGALDSIKGRGTATWQAEKKSYGIKLFYPADLFGMGEGENWILLANTFDCSKIRNKICLEMAEALGLKGSTECEWVDLYLNGQYHGNYLLCEKIEVGDGRVEIADLETETKKLNQDLKQSEVVTNGNRKGVAAEKNPDDLTGGYIIERDLFSYDRVSSFVTDNGDPFSLKAPQYATVEQVDYIADYVQQIENGILSGDEEVFAYLDLESSVLRYLLEEVVLNTDFGITSMFFYKERKDPLLYAGPVWDYDRSMGANGFMYSDILLALEIKEYKEQSSLSWYPYLYENPVFHREMIDQYQKKVKPYVQYLIDEKIDLYKDKVYPSARLDAIRWPPQGFDVGYYQEFEHNIEFIKFFLGRRLSFLDHRWLGREQSYGPQGDGQWHQVIFEGREQTKIIRVLDGECVTDAPDELLAEGDWWMNRWNRIVYSSQLPVYEDVVYRAVSD